MLDLTIPTGEGRSIVSIVSTSGGRIFGCSTASSGASSSTGAGDLYEIIYNAKEGLFSKKCYLVNLSSGGSGVDWVLPSFMRSGSSATDSHVVQVVVDRERELLYTRLRNNSIELWNIQRGKNAEKVATVRDVKRLAGMLCPGTPLINSTNTPFEIVGMEIIPSKEGKGIGLLCVTNTGVRLYFTHQRGGLRGYGPSQSNSQNPPQVLELVHVRLPPQNASSNGGAYTQGSTNNISIASIPSNGGGFFLSANTVSDDSDVLLVYANDIGRLANSIASGSRLSLVEVAGNIPIEGRTWAIAEVTKSSALYPANELKYEMASTSIQGGKRDFLFLTNMGMHIVSRQRPVDCLMVLLDTAPGAGRDAELAAFAEA
jgi:nuclear pore complex protein Nup155